RDNHRRLRHRRPILRHHEGVNWPSRVFLSGQAVSLLGDGLTVLAIPLLVLGLTRSPLISALSAASTTLGYLAVLTVAASGVASGTGGPSPLTLVPLVKPPNSSDSTMSMTTRAMSQIRQPTSLGLRRPSRRPYHLSMSPPVLRA